jgi:hypothetical protein
MLTVETDIHDEGACRVEVSVFTTRGDLIRRILKDEEGQVVRDFTYEYDPSGRCLSGIVMDGDHRVILKIENIYTSNGVQLESIERDPVSEDEIYRVSYILNSKENVERVDYFDRGVKIGFSKPDDPLDEYSLHRYFDERGNEVPYLSAGSSF